MSNRLRNLALKLTFRFARIKGTFMYLCDRADEKGVCWPKQETVAAGTGFSLPSVRRSLDRVPALVPGRVPDVMSCRLVSRRRTTTFSLPGGSWP